MSISLTQLQMVAMLVKWCTDDQLAELFDSMPYDKMVHIWDVLNTRINCGQWPNEAH